MAVLTIELYSESISDLEKVFDEFGEIPLPDGVLFDDYEIITDLACPECDGCYQEDNRRPAVENKHQRKLFA